MRVEAEAGACAGKKALAKLAKEQNLDAIHDTVHEMAKDEARHGRAFQGLLKSTSAKPQTVEIPTISDNHKSDPGRDCSFFIWTDSDTYTMRSLHLFLNFLSCTFTIPLRYFHACTHQKC